MSFAFCLSRCFLALSLSLISLIPAQSQAPISTPNPSQFPTEPAVRAVVEKYFALYAAKDPEGLMSLWSEKSPDYASYKQSLQEQIATEDYSFGIPAISRLKLEGERASLRATVDLTAINLKSNQKREQRIARNFALVREDGKWKMWRYAPAANDLAEALANANTEAEREGLLAEEKELLTSELGRAMHAQSRRLFSQGSYKRALDISELVLKIAEPLGDKGLIANGLRSIGSSSYMQGNYAEALERYNKSLKIYEELGDRAGIASLLNNTGSIHRSRGNYTEALDQLQKSLKIYEDLGDKAGMANALNNTGLTHSFQGNYTEALEQYQKSLKISEEIGDDNVIASILTGIGTIHHSQGSYIQALEQYQKSLKIYEKLGNKSRIADTLNNFGIVHFSQGNYAQALERFQKNLEIYEEIGNKSGLALTLNNLGDVHGSQGNYAQALEQFQKSLMIKQEIGDKAGIASALNNIGNVHRLQGNYAQALERLQKSLEIYEEIGKKAGIASLLNDIGEAHRLQGDHTQALKFAERAATLAREIGSLELIWRSRVTTGKAYFSLKQLDHARLAFDDAIVTIEILRTRVAGGAQEQQRFFESRVSPYHAMGGLLIAQNNPREALSYAERAKARVLLDILSSGRVSVTKRMTDLEIEQERKLNSQLVSLNTQIYLEKQRQQADQNRLDWLDSQLQKARLDFEEFQTNLYAAHPELKPHRGEAPVIKSEGIAELVTDPRSALLEYVVTDDHTYLFAITKAPGATEAEVRSYTLLIKRAELAKRIESFRRQLAGRDLGFRSPARQLYQLLLKPAEAQLRGITNLVIAPDDQLWGLPFQALLTGDNRFLIEDAAIAYTPSLTALRDMMKRRKNQGGNSASATLLAMGNPLLSKETIQRATLSLRDEKLDPLPEAEQEVAALSRLYGRARSKVYIGAEAREDRAKSEAGQARILHFATHGILNNAAPMYSHLVFAQGDMNEDGLLEAWELMKMDLHADLAVLSACETARGRFGAGEGVIGLTWAMFIAGAPAIVVSQWKVESASTRDLMLAFHRQLRAPSASVKLKATKAGALRQAALTLMKKSETSHPFYWAGFVLVGDGR